MEHDFSAFGGTPQQSVMLSAVNPGDILSCGWIAPLDRTSIQQTADTLMKQAIPNLAIPKGAYDNATFAYLWECWNAAFPSGWKGIRQITGSCVGAGGGNALFSLAAADIVKRGDKERAVVPFWLLPYAISRMLGGLLDRGDGSWGTPFAKACREFGHIPADTPGLPQFTISDGYVWGKEAELNWSQGQLVDRKFLDAAKPYLVRSTALCRTADDVRDALKNFYPVTCASDWGGLMNPPVVEGHSLNRRYTTWNHQMSIHGWKDHPKLGEIFFIKNQWGSAHTLDPATGFMDGFWVKRADVDYIARQGETFAYSQFDGFPAIEVPLDFSAFGNAA